MVVSWLFFFNKVYQEIKLNNITHLKNKNEKNFYKINVTIWK